MNQARIGGNVPLKWIGPSSRMGRVELVPRVRSSALIVELAERERIEAGNWAKGHAADHLHDGWHAEFFERHVAIIPARSRKSSRPAALAVRAVGEVPPRTGAIHQLSGVQGAA